jgi:epoxyqueuosine reductase
MELLKESLRKRARELGFVHCGFTSAEPPDHYPAFANWIAAGRQAGMDYLATERSLSMRAQPCRLLPSARSMIALAMPYPPPPDFENLPLEGRVAAYAQGADYHEIIPDRLRLLCRDLDSLAGGRLHDRSYVVTFSILLPEVGCSIGHTLIPARSSNGRSPRAPDWDGSAEIPCSSIPR